MNNLDLLANSYNYDLPNHLIAKRPSPGRDTSRLLVYKKSEDKLIDTDFFHIDKHLPENSMLIANQTKVFPCRLVGQKETGGKCEVFILSLEKKDTGYHCLINTNGKKRINDKYLFNNKTFVASISVINGDGTFNLEFEGDKIENYLDKFGKIPLPPYIREGDSDKQDIHDYQTVYAKHLGSVAAPTAGLHFTPEVFDSLERKNIDKAFVSLHVGMGTFTTVKDQNINDHKMHSEKYFIEQKHLTKISNAYNNKKQIIAVGTTSLRVLESSFEKISTGTFSPDTINSTNIFLHPGKEIKSINGLITNFHLPKSTLLMLVSSLIGREKVLEIYKHAIKKEYRFFSYGDAMLLLP